MRIRFLTFTALLSLALPAIGQDNASVQALLDKFKAERAEAIDKKFPASSLERADEHAMRAAEALQLGNLPVAAKLAREARWLVPYVPGDLPPFVERVLGIARMRHGDEVYGVAWSPDGGRLATASKDGTVKIWDLANGRQLRAYRGSPELVLAVDWSRDGKLIASTAGKEIHLWDPETGKLKTTLKGHDEAVHSVAFRPDGQTLVSSSASHGSTGGDTEPSVRIWDVAKGEQVMELVGELGKKRPRSKFLSVAYSPNGKLIASVTDDGKLHVWAPEREAGKRHLLGTEAHGSQSVYSVAFGKDTSTIFTAGGDDRARQWVGFGPTGEAIPSGGSRGVAIEGHAGDVRSVAVTRDGKFVATASDDKTIRLWDMTGPAPRLARMFQGHTEQVLTLAFSPDGQTLASGGADQAVRLWRVSLGDDHTNFADSKGYVWSAAFSPDGQAIASAGVDRVVVIRDLAGKVLNRFEGHTAPVTALAYSPDGAKLASVGGDMVVRIWSAKGNGAAKELKGHTAPVMAVAFGNNGLVLTGGIDKQARLWNVDKDAPLFTFAAGKSAVSAVAIRNDSKQCLIGYADGTVKVFDLTGDPKELSTAGAHAIGVGGLAYSADGKKVATCGVDTLVKQWMVLDNGTLSLVGEMKGHTKPVSSVSFNADGRLLASCGGDMAVRVWDLTNRTEIRALRGHLDWVSSVAFAPNGRSLLSAGVDKTVKVWELSGDETSRPPGHTRKLTTLAASADGRWVASGSEDRTIKIWDAVAGVEAFTLDAAAGGHDLDVTSVAFDPSGKKLVSGGDDKKIVIWDLETKRPLQTLNLDQLVPYIVFSLKGDRFVAWQSPAQTSREGTGSQVKSYSPDGKPMASLDLKDREVQCMTFAVDGQLAAMGFKDGSVQLWDLTKNERLGGDWAAFSKDLGDIAVTPDKKIVVASDVECNIKIYDIAGKKVLKELKAHTGGLNGIMMGPDGKRFATISSNGEVKLWQTEDGKELRSWSLATPVRNLAFSADGKKLMTANSDSTLYVLTLP